METFDWHGEYYTTEAGFTFNMVLSRAGLPWMIFYDFSKGLTQQQCLESHRSTFVNESPSEKTVYNWFAEFCHGRASVSDEFHEARQDIDVVRNMIEDNRHVTYRKTEASLGISKTAVHSILHEHLAMKKICSLWIPYNLTETQKQAHVNWCKEMLKKYTTS